MARLRRYAAPGHVQHIVQRGNNRAATFRAEADYRFFYLCLRAACERHGCAVHAYVFMTNHVHLLVTPADSAAIARTLQSVGRRYVQHFNAAYARTGGLWEGRYHATVVDTERYLATCHRYVERNPVRAGVVAQARAYPWSSHRANAHGEEDPLVTPHAWYVALGDDRVSRQAAYRGLFALDDPDAVIAAIRDATQRGWALGGARFRKELESSVRRRTEPLRAGRPSNAERRRERIRWDPQQNDAL